MFCDGASICGVDSDLSAGRGRGRSQQTAWGCRCQDDLRALGVELLE